MNTVDLKTLSAASPSALFESLASVVQEPGDAAITIIYTEGAEVTGVETHQLPISWVDLVEDIPFNALQHSAQGFVIIVWGERAGEDLPERVNLNELIDCLRTSTAPMLKDVFFCDGNRYWSYMCEGCCDPEGKPILGRAQKAEAKAQSVPSVSELLHTLSEGSSQDENLVMVQLCELVQNVRNRDSLMAMLAVDETTSKDLISRVSCLLDHATTEQLPRVAGMVAALKAGYAFPKREVRSAIDQAGEDSLAQLVQRGLSSGVPASLYRQVFIQAANKLVVNQ